MTAKSYGLVRSRDKLNNYISINSMSMAINFGRVGIYNEEIPSIRSPDS